MVAAKVMDVIARLSKCDGQAADAVSAYTQMNWETLPLHGNVFHDTNGRNPGQTFKILWYFLNEIYMDPHWQDCNVKDNSRKLY